MDLITINKHIICYNHEYFYTNLHKKTKYKSIFIGNITYVFVYIFTLIRNLYLMDRNTYILLFDIVVLFIIVFSHPFIDILNRNKRGRTVNSNTMLQKKRINILKIGSCDNQKQSVTIDDLVL